MTAWVMVHGYGGSRRPMRKACSFIIISLLAGCASFESKPITPAQTASAFEARTLQCSDLKAFLESSLHIEMTPWPPEAWDFAMLYLAACFYHPSLEVARTKWGVAKAGIITAGQRPNPAVGFTPQYAAKSPPGVPPWILTFTIDIPIETAGKRGYRITQAQSLSEAARAKIATAAWQVRSGLRARLLSLYAAERAQALLQEQMPAQAKMVQLMEQRLSAGEAALPEVTLLRIASARVEISLRGAQRQVAEARVQVADAIGVPAGALQGAVLSFQVFERFPSKEDLPDRGVRGQALLGRSDILSSLAEYAASQAALQLEIAKQYPDIHIGPGYSWDQGEDKWSVGVSIILPVLNRNEGPIAEAEARRAAEAASFNALQAAIIGEIDRSLAGYLGALQKLQTADSLLKAQETELRSEEAMFKTGQTDRLTLLGARVEFYSIALSRLNAFVEVQQSLGLLEDAVQRPLDM